MSKYDINEPLNVWEDGLNNSRKRKQEWIDSLIEKYGFPVREENLLKEDFALHDMVKDDLAKMEKDYYAYQSQPRGLSLDDEDMEWNAERGKVQKDTTSQTDADAELLKRIREKSNKSKKYDNNLNAKQREEMLRNNQELLLDIDDNPKENGEWKWWCNHNIGAEAVRKYNNLIEKYTQRYNVDSNLVKAIMYTENACGHYYGGNAIADYIGISKSQMPMNIRSNIWSNFQGKHYDTRNPAQNIELATLLIKQISNSIVNPTAEKIITIWNSAGKNKISSFGYRGGMAYRNKLWLREIK